MWKRIYIQLFLPDSVGRREVIHKVMHLFIFLFLFQMLITYIYQKAFLFFGKKKQNSKKKKKCSKYSG